MTDLVPSEERISRKALERIIQRAAELQATGRDLGDSLTEGQVLELGKEVGIPARLLQQAMMEERMRPETAGAQGVLTRWMGPSRVMAQRTMPGNRSDIEDALSNWMTERELLTVKRQYKQQTSWEARRDFMASLKRGLGLGGRRYVLSRTKEVLGEVRQLEEGWCHVSLAADLTNSRKEHLGGAAAVTAGGTSMTVVAGVLGVFWAAALLPLALGVAAGLGITRSRRSITERVQVALEQILDRLERGEDVPRTEPAFQPQAITKLLRDEVRKHLGP